MKQRTTHEQFPQSYLSHVGQTCRHVADRAACAKWTQDSQVFAAVIGEGSVIDTCLAKAKVLEICAAAFGDAPYRALGRRRRALYRVHSRGATISAVNRTGTGGAMLASTKFSEDIVPLSDMKVNPGRIVRHVDETRRPVLLTSRGRGVAVVQALADYEAETEERAFLRGVVQGLMDLEEGRETDLGEVKSRLGLA